MNRKWMVVAVVVVALLVAAVPAMAAGPGSGNRFGAANGLGGGQQLRQGRDAFALVGTITALGTDTITVQVQAGNRYVKDYIGQELAVQVTANTKYMRWTQNGSVPIGFADLEVGDSTNIHGLVSDDIFTATRVTVDVPMLCSQP
jgi:hypothetical protein